MTQLDSARSHFHEPGPMGRSYRGYYLNTLSKALPNLQLPVWIRDLEVPKVSTKARGQFPRSEGLPDQSVPPNGLVHIDLCSRLLLPKGQHWTTEGQVDAIWTRMGVPYFLWDPPAPHKITKTKPGSPCGFYRASKKASHPHTHTHTIPHTRTITHCEIMFDCIWRIMCYIPLEPISPGTGDLHPDRFSRQPKLQYPKVRQVTGAYMPFPPYYTYLCRLICIHIIHYIYTPLCTRWSLMFGERPPHGLG